MSLLLKHLNAESLLRLLWQWLDIRCTCTFDTAVTNSVARPMFMKSLRAIEGSILDCWHHSHASLRWFIERNLKPSIINAANYGSKRESTFTVNESSFRGIEMPSVLSIDLLDVETSNEMFDFIARGCPHLQSIKLSGSAVVNRGLGCGSDHTTGLLISRVFISSASLVALVNQFPRLQTIDLSHFSSNADDLPLIAQGCSQLRSIVIRGFSHIFPIPVRSCPQLHSITGPLSDSDLSALGSGCPDLQMMDSSTCSRITDAGVLNLVRGCPKLRSLLFCHYISDVALIAIAQGCPLLETLRVKDCRNIGEAGMLAIAEKCPRLKSLYAMSCGMNCTSEAVISAIVRGCPNLESISVKLYGDHLSIIGQNCPNLKSIKVLTNISQVGVLALASGCPLLESIDFNFYKGGNIGFEALAKGCPLLHTLILKNVLEESLQAGMISIAHSCSQLRTVHLNRCKWANDAVMLALSEGCPQLESLELSYCRSVTDKGLSALAKGCSQLRHLNLMFADNITDVGLSALALGCPQLRWVKLEGFAYISDEGLTALYHGCPHLHTLHADYRNGVAKKRLTGVEAALDSASKAVSIVGWLAGYTIRRVARTWQQP